MLPSLFREPEHELILSYLEEWDRLKGQSKERDDNGDLFNLQGQLVDNILQDLFEQFPERDISHHPVNPLAFQQEDRDRLHMVSDIPLVQGCYILFSG
jgi:hypothetical protein